MRIIVTGATGQLGTDLAAELLKRKHDVYGFGSRELDITDAVAVSAALARLQPDAVMHCAAFTAVDLAEDEKERCDEINRVGTKNIARACAEISCKLLYISTDYVFPGDGDRPWQPDDPAEPLNYYGLTKFQGEEAVRAATDTHFIVRISWVFGLHGKNFVKTMLRLGAERDTLTVVGDQIGSPTYTRDLSVLLADMIETEHFGTYHATNEGFCSWYQFADAIIRKAGLAARVNPVASTEYPTKAKRPLNSRMSKDKLTEKGFDRLPTWEDALDRFLKEMDEANGKD